MSITSANLLQPLGDVSPDWFPGLSSADVAALLDAYIADAASRITVTGIDGDNATRAYAMGRAARNVYMRLSNTPATATLTGEGSQSITGEQIRAFKTMAEKYEAEFATFTAAAPTPADEPSGAVANSYVW